MKSDIDGVMMSRRALLGGACLLASIPGLRFARLGKVAGYIELRG